MSALTSGTTEEVVPECSHAGLQQTATVQFSNKNFGRIPASLQELEFGDELSSV